MSKPTSPNQLAANRRNALKSTGPRTPEGRAVSRMNAVRHGILSKQVLVRGRVLQEDEKELEALHARFHEDMQPEGPLEEMLVDQIVTAHWRLRRALAAESGEIALSLDDGQRKRSEGTDPVLRWMQWTAFGDPVHAMEKSTLGCSILRDRLRGLRDSVEAEGILTEAAVQKVAAQLGGKPNTLVLSLEDFRRKQEAEPSGDDDALRERQKTAALDFLNRKLNSIQFMLECRDEEAYYVEEGRQAAALLPSAAVLDKILRYETKLERQMYRAMTQLERVQRMRRGETIPAPLSVEVSNRE